MIRTYSQIHRTYTFSQYSSIINPVWLNRPNNLARLQTRWLWVRVPLQSLTPQVFLGIQATVDSEFTLKHVRGMLRTYSQFTSYVFVINTQKYTKHFLPKADKV